MPHLAEPVLCRFDDLVLDRQAGTLSRVHADGPRTSVQLGSRALQILCLLVDRHGEVVSSREIMDVVWGSLAVEANNLTVQLSALRRVLDPGREQGSCIQNVPGRGYRFVPEVTISPSLRDAPAAAQADDAQVATDAPPGQPPPVTTALASAARPRHWHIAWVAASLCAAAALTAAAWYASHTLPSHIEATIAPAPATPATIPPMERPRLSLVVLPFSNLGGDGVNNDVVDAIADDLTTDLSRWRDALVIARNSAVTYKGKPIDIRRVGEELGVHYAVEGSVRGVDGALRVNVQLVATDTGAQLWAERLEVRRDGIGYDVDDIGRQISFVLGARIVDTEAAHNLRERPSNPDVADILLRANAVYNRPVTPQRLVELVSLYERALELDPNSATALAGLTEALLNSISPFAEDPSAPGKIRRAEHLLQRAELLRPDDWRVMLGRVHLLGAQGRCRDVIPAAQRAADAYTFLSGPHQWIGICLILEGKPAEAILALQQSIRRHPRNPSIFTRYRLIGYASLFAGQYDDSVQWFGRALAANPGDDPVSRSSAYASMAAAQALGGHIEEARSSAVEAERLNPRLTVRSRFPFNLNSPAAFAQVASMREGMRLAGIRDHADEDADPGLPSDDRLQPSNEAPTPTTAPGVHTIRTPDLTQLIQQRHPLVLDTTNWGQSIPGAVGLWGAGIGGSTSDHFQERLARKMQQLTGGDRTMPVVAMGFNSERYQGRNLALRLVALGYTEVYWYRGGREAWQVAGLPEAELVLQDW
jgi:TolB-like protein/DNA-binding winged helix-turn-helix (wHTH) protein/tetratricopeptide (TPR) repeat protein